MTAKRKVARRRAGTGTGGADRPLAWPGDPETVMAGPASGARHGSGAVIDFEALAHVLANTCRRGGRCRRYHSVAAHAVIVSEEIESLDGLAEDDRRRLALHALLAEAPSAWLRGQTPDSQRAAERTGKLAVRIGAAVREAAGLDSDLDGEPAELLRFVTRMAAAAESRDLLDGDAASRSGAVFPPLKRRIRPMPPEKAARAWLARFRALDGDRVEAGTGGGAKQETADELSSHAAAS